MTPADDTPPTMRHLVFGDGTPRKALLSALVVGTVLTAINNGDRIVMMGEWPPLAKLLLTFCVPYCVTTWGAVTGKGAQWKRACKTHKKQTERAQPITRN